MKKLVICLGISALFASASYAVPLSTFLKNFAVDKNANYSAVDWEDIKIKGYKWRGNTFDGYSTVAKIDNTSSGTMSGKGKIDNTRVITFKGPRTMVFNMAVEQQSSLYEELNSLSEMKDKGMKVKKIASKCNIDGASYNVQLYAVNLPNKKTIYGLETFSAGSGGNLMEWVFSIDGNFYTSDDEMESCL